VAGCTSVLGELLQEYGTGAAGAAWTLGLLITIALSALFNLLIGGGRQATHRSGAADCVDSGDPATAVPRAGTGSAARRQALRFGIAGTGALGRDAGR
jgi:hypothetical protein